jgi:hypothetical protein
VCSTAKREGNLLEGVVDLRAIVLHPTNGRTPPPTDRHAFKEPFPAEFPRQAGKREDTHGYYMCLVPRSALAVLEAMDDDLDAALIDQREKEAYPTLRNRGCEREAEGTEEEEEEDREGFESSADILCRHFPPFRMELQVGSSLLSSLSLSPRCCFF